MEPEAPGGAAAATDYHRTTRADRRRSVRWMPPRRHLRALSTLATNASSQSKENTMATYEQSLLIGGQWMPADSGKTYECVNPFTGKAATRAAAASVGDVARAVSAAQDAFGAWAVLPPSKRRQYMLAAADAI